MFAVKDCQGRYLKGNYKSAQWVTHLDHATHFERSSSLWDERDGALYQAQRIPCAVVVEVHMQECTKAVS